MLKRVFILLAMVAALFSAAGTAQAWVSIHDISRVAGQGKSLLVDIRYNFCEACSPYSNYIKVDVGINGHSYSQQSGTNPIGVTGTQSFTFSNLLQVGDGSVDLDIYCEWCGNWYDSKCLKILRKGSNPMPEDCQDCEVCISIDGDGNATTTYSGQGVPNCIGQPVTVDLHYNSKDSGKGSCGTGWNHTYDTRIVRDNTVMTIDDGWQQWTEEVDGTIEVQSREGTLHEYVRENGVIKAPPGVNATLVKNQDDSYTITEKDKTKYAYNTDGKLVNITDKNDKVNTMTYDANGRLWKITDPSGRETSFTYNASGYISSITDAANRTFTYSYTGDNLTGITDPEGNTTGYAYGGPGGMMSTLSKNGTPRYSVQYDDDTYEVIVLGSGGENNSYSYNATSGTATRTKGGVSTTYKYSVEGRITEETKPGGSVTRWAYDDRGNTTRITTPGGRITSYTYDSRDNVTGVTDPMGGTTHYAYDAADNITSVTDTAGRSTNYTYDDSGNLLSITDPKGKSTGFAYNSYGKKAGMTDANGNVTSYSYDTNGNLTQVTQPGGITTSYTYDAADNMLTQTSPTGKITSYTYDQTGRLTRTTYPDSSYEDYTYNCCKLTSRRYPDGRTVSYTYDTKSRLGSISDPLTGTTSYTYDGRDNVTQITDGRGKVTSYTYDAYDNVTRITDHSGNHIDYQYDSDNRLTKITDQRGKETALSYDARGRIVSTTDPEGNVTTMTYDEVDNILTQSIGSQGISMSYDGNNNLLAVRDALGRTTAREYDDLNRVSSLTDPSGEVTQYTYDALSRLIEAQDPMSQVSTQTYDNDNREINFTDPNGNTTTYTYDNYGRVSSMTTKGGRSIGYAYNSLGQVVTITNGRGQNTSLSYDAAGRIESSTDPAGTVSYSYDAAGNLTAAGGRSRTYDDLNRVVSTTYNTDTTSYQYDAAGNMTGITYPGNKQVQYSYDNAGRLKAVTDWNNRITTYTYSATGQVTKIERSNGTVLNNTYDAAGQLTKSKDTKANGTVIAQYDYVYDDNGNIKAELSSNAPQVVSGTDESLVYGSDNRLTSYNGTAITYDNDGNALATPLSGTMEALSYDARSRLTAAAGHSYSYDGENNLTGITENGQTTGFTVDVNASLSRVLIRRNPDNTTTYYIYGLGLIAEEKVAGETTEYRAYHYDYRGSTVALTDEDGDVTDRYSYGPYGEMVQHTGTSDTLFQYNGRDGVMTDTNGLYYMRARFYNPAVRRFVNMDPLLGTVIDGQSLNRYAYVEGNPVNSVDPLGLYSHREDGPWHPAEGTLTKCNPSDSCSQLSYKMQILRRMINSHIAWDKAHNTNRHGIEISDRQNEYNRCVAIHQKNCVDKPKKRCKACQAAARTVKQTVVVGGTAYIIYRVIKVCILTGVGGLPGFVAGVATP